MSSFSPLPNSVVDSNQIKFVKHREISNRRYLLVFRFRCTHQNLGCKAAALWKDGHIEWKKDHDHPLVVSGLSPLCVQREKQLESYVQGNPDQTGLMIARHLNDQLKRNDRKRTELYITPQHVKMMKAKLNNHLKHQAMKGSLLLHATQSTGNLSLRRQKHKLGTDNRKSKTRDKPLLPPVQDLFQTPFLSSILPKVKIPSCRDTEPETNDPLRNRVKDRTLVSSFETENGLNRSKSFLPRTRFCQCQNIERQKHFTLSGPSN